MMNAVMERIMANAEMVAVDAPLKQPRLAAATPNRMLSGKRQFTSEHR